MVHNRSILFSLPLKIAVQYSIVWVFHNLFSQSPTDEHLSSFQCFAISNNATMNNLGRIHIVCLVQICLYLEPNV